MSGKRGRPRIGETRKVSITLPIDAWNEIVDISGFDPEHWEESPGNLSKAIRDIIIEKLYQDRTEAEKIIKKMTKNKK